MYVRDIRRSFGSRWSFYWIRTEKLYDHRSQYDMPTNVSDAYNIFDGVMMPIGDTSDSHFEAIVDEIMHYRPPSCAHHNTLNVPMSL